MPNETQINTNLDSEKKALDTLKLLENPRLSPISKIPSISWNFKKLQMYSSLQI